MTRSKPRPARSGPSPVPGCPGLPPSWEFDVLSVPDPAADAITVPAIQPTAVRNPPEAAALIIAPCRDAPDPRLTEATRTKARIPTPSPKTVGKRMLHTNPFRRRETCSVKMNRVIRERSFSVIPTH